METIVELDGIGVSRAGRPILREITLQIGRGRVLGVAGPNGSGKTTLLRLVATLLPPDRGRGLVLAAALGSDSVRSIRGEIGMMGHIPALVGELTLGENLLHVCRLAGIDPSRIPRVLEVVGLDEVSERRANEASHGMQRRAEIAHLLLRRPRLLLIDEATSGLDSEAQELVGALLGRTLEDGGGVAIASHDRDQLAGADELVTLSSGRVMT